MLRRGMTDTVCDRCRTSVSLRVPVTTTSSNEKFLAEKEVSRAASCAAMAPGRQKAEARRNEDNLLFIFLLSIFLRTQNYNGTKKYAITGPLKILPILQKMTCHTHSCYEGCAPPYLGLNPPWSEDMSHSNFTW